MRGRQLQKQPAYRERKKNKTLALHSLFAHVHPRRMIKSLMHCLPPLSPSAPRLAENEGTTKISYLSFLSYGGVEQMLTGLHVFLPKYTHKLLTRSTRVQVCTVHHRQYADINHINDLTHARLFILLHPFKSDGGLSLTTPGKN